MGGILSNAVGAVVAPFVLPSLVIPFQPPPRPSKVRGHACSISFFQHKGLDSVEVVPDRFHERAVQDRKHVVAMFGNAARLDMCLPVVIDFATKYNVAVVSFDFRGVGASTGFPTSYHHLVQDAVEQVNRIAKNDPDLPWDNITLYGQSLGGAVACFAGQLLHGQSKPVRVIADRTFANIKDLVPHFVTLFASNFRVPQFLIACVCYLAAVAIPLRWQINPEDVFRDNNLEIDSFAIINVPEDAMIPGKYSLLDHVPSRVRNACGFEASRTIYNPKGGPLARPRHGFFLHEIAIHSSRTMWNEWKQTTESFVGERILS